MTGTRGTGTLMTLEAFPSILFFRRRKKLKKLNKKKSRENFNFVRLRPEISSYSIEGPGTCVAVPWHLCCSAHEKKKEPNLHSNRQLEPPPPLNFSYRIFGHSALAPNFSFNLARQIWAPWCTPVSVAKRQQFP